MSNAHGYPLPFGIRERDFYDNKSLSSFSKNLFVRKLSVNFFAGQESVFKNAFEKDGFLKYYRNN
ncbi:hypothetical protein LCGC14_1089830 [marine sediment metagenome]|uniref:Uncharacterized protein n=1 Tax=marine sediment metagenome TaxID=412755 RepID=A0A0F9N0D3_9ZZZZ